MVNTNEIAKEYRLSHWAQIIQQRTENREQHEHPGVLHQYRN